MFKFKNSLSIHLFLIFFLLSNASLSDNHNVFEILEKEDKWKKAYPNLADRLEDLELEVRELQDRVHSLDRKGVVGDFYD